MIAASEAVRALGALLWGTVARRMQTVLVALVCVLAVLAWIALARAQRAEDRAARAVAVERVTVAETVYVRMQPAVTRTTDRVTRAMARWQETRGAVGGHGGARIHDTAVTVAPVTAVIAACDEIASACAAFRDTATAALAAADRVIAAQRVVIETPTPRPAWWRPHAQIGGACVVAGAVRCGPGFSIGWRIGP